MFANSWKILGVAALLVALAALAPYLLFDVFEVGGVAVPNAPKIDLVNVKHLNVEQGWKDGWRPGEAQWFHHASQGTRILPYDWFINLEQPSLSLYNTPPKLVEGDYLQRFGFLPSVKDPEFNPGARLPIGFAIEANFDAPYANPPSQGKVVGLTCAACHTGQVTYREDGKLKAIRIEGGSAMINLSAFQQAVGFSLGYTLQFDARFARFARGVLGDKNGNYDLEKAKILRADLQKFLDAGLASREYLRIHKLNGTDAGFSRTDALGLIGNRVFAGVAPENQIVTDAPVNFPPLWDTAWFDWVQYNASIRMPMVRNIGEALGVGAAVNLDDEAGTSRGTRRPLYDSTVNVLNLHLLEEQLGGHDIFEGLRPPRWPETVKAFGAIDEAKKGRGAEIYQARCERCHLPPTDELRALAQDPQSAGFKRHFVVDQGSKKAILKLVTSDLHEIGTDPNQAMNLYRRVAVFNGSTISAAQGLYAVTEFIRRDKFRGLDKDQASEWNRYRSFDESAPAEVEAGKHMDQVLKANLKYKARPLDGIWATPPYLHNSSVPSLHQLLLPASSRVKTFHLGSTLYDREHLGFATDEFPGAFRMDTTLPGNLNSGHEFRNLTIEEFESIPEYRCRPGPTDKDRDRWNRALAASLPDSKARFETLDGESLRALIREATDATLRLGRVRRDHPFRGVLGPEFTEDERSNLLEFLKSL